MYEIDDFDIWTPRQDADRHLAKTVIHVAHYADGEWVEYLTSDASTGWSRCCCGETFRQWISKMKATRTVDEELKASSESYE